MAKGNRSDVLGILVFHVFVFLAAAMMAAQELPAPGRAEPGRTQAVSSADESASSSGIGGQRLIRFHGSVLDAAGRPVRGVAGVTFAIYAEQSGGVPLWQETQNVQATADGRFSALLGLTSATGIPAELFSTGEARWLAVLTHAPGAAEQPRVLLVNVPYALHAADSEMLGGKPASAYVTVAAHGARGGACGDAGSPLNPAPVSAPPPSVVPKGRPLISANGATAGYLPVFTSGSGDMKSSLLYQSGSNLGFGTTAPIYNLQFVSQVDPAAIAVDGYGAVGINFIGRRAEGTLAAPSALLVNDNIMAMQGRGYGSTAFSPYSRAFMKFFAAENWSDTAQGTYISLATTTKGTSPNASATERMRITDAGLVGIGTQTPTHTLSFGGGQANTLGMEANPTPGGAGNSLSIAAGAAAAGSSNQQGGSLLLAAGTGTGSGAGGDVRLQTAGDTTSSAASDTVSDRLLVAGKPKAMSGSVPTANLFSVHLAAGEAAGGKVKFTIVASDGVNYAMETGELIYLASPMQMSCAVVVSKYLNAPPSYTNTVLAMPGIGQSGYLNATCNPTTFGGDPGVQIFDTAPTTFRATTHKVYYTIENQSQAAITLQP